MTYLRKENKHMNNFKQYLATFDSLMDPFTILWRDNFMSDSEFKTFNRGELKYPVDVFTEDNKLNFEIAAIGIDDKDLDISVEGNKLRVKYQKEETEEKEERGIIHKGIARRSFDYSWKIDTSKYNLDDIAVHLDKGLLAIAIPLAAQAIPKKLTINAKA